MVEKVVAVIELLHSMKAMSMNEKREPPGLNALLGNFVSYLD